MSGLSNGVSGVFERLRGATNWGPRPSQSRRPPAPSLGADAGYSPETIAVAVMLVLTNAATRRIVEQITIRGTTLFRETTTEIVLDPDLRKGCDRIVVPVAAGSREQLWDTQEVVCDGDPVSVLVHAENVIFARAVLSEAWHRTFGGETPGGALYTHVLSVPDSDGDDARATVDALRNALATWIGADSARRDRADDLFEIVNFFSRNYLVFAELPTGCGHRVAIRRRVAAPYEPRRRGALRHWRWRAGLRPVTLSIPLYGAPSRAMSYHLRVTAPDGYHVHSNDLLVGDGLSGEWRYDESQRGSWAPRGGDYAHFYVASSHAEPAVRTREALVAKVKFAEDLPGSLVGAFVPAAMIAALTVLSLVAYPLVFPYQTEDAAQSALDQANSSFAPLLLAIPGFTSLWFRPRRVDELVRVPLTSLVAPFFSGTLSFGLAVLFLGFRMSPCHQDAFGRVTQCHETRRLVSWSTLTVLSVVWAGYLLWQVCAKNRSERYCHPRFAQQPRPRRRSARPNPRRGWPLFTGASRTPAPAPPPGDAVALDVLYEQMDPTSRRGDLYVKRAESFDFPFSASARSSPATVADVTTRVKRLLDPPKPADPRPTPQPAKPQKPRLRRRHRAAAANAEPPAG